MNLILKNLLLFLIFSVPLVIPFGSYGYEQAKVVVFIIGIELACLIWILKGIFQKRLNFKLSILKVLSLLFVLTLILTSGLSNNWELSFIGAQPYYQGVVLYIFLYLFFLLVSSSKISFKESALMIFLSSVVVSGFAIADWVQLNVYHQNILNYAGRPISTFGQPNFYSGFLVSGLPFLLFLPSIFLFTGVVLGSIAIVLSGSRIGILLLFLVIAVIFTVKFKILINKYLGVTLVILLLALLPLSPVLFSSNIYKEFCQPLFEQWLLEDSTEKRILIWPIILELINSRLFLGYGLENMSSNFTNYSGFTDLSAKPVYFHSLKNLIIDRSHNYSLDLLFFSGILGLGSWMLLFWYGLNKSKNIILMFTLLVYFIWAQIQNQSVVNLMMFWLILGLIDQEGVDS